MYEVKQSTALTLPFFAHDVSGDAVTGLTNGSFTKRISKNGAAFGAMTVTITELENGWYSIPLSASHSDTLGLMTIVFTNAGAKQINLQFRVEANLVDDVVADIATAQLDLDTITGADGTTLASAQGPVTFTGVTNEAGITLAGAGTGPGLSSTGGLTGDGITTVGGATSGDGINASADGSGNGIDAVGIGANAGLRVEGGATGAGIHAHGGATGSTPGVEFHAHSATGDALELEVDGSGDTNADLAAILLDTADMQPKIGTPAADVSADIAAVKTETALIVADTNELQVDWTNGGRLDLILDIIAADTTTDIPALIAALNDIAAADVLTQVNAALDTAISELGVAAPTATPTLRTGLMLMYMALRNKTIVQTSGTDALEIHNDAGTLITQKLLTDDGSDYTEAEMT